MRKGTTVVSAGALTLALSGVTALLVAAPAAAAPARPAGCDGGGGPSSGLTDDLCGLLGGVADTVDHLTRDLDGITRPIDETADKLLGGDRSSAGPSPAATPPAPASPKAAAPSGSPADDSPTGGELLRVPVDTSCLPLIASDDCDREAVSPTPRPPAPRDRSTPTPAPLPVAPSPSPSPSRVPDAPRSPEPAKTPTPLSPSWPVEPGPTGGARPGGGSWAVEVPRVTPSPVPSADVETPPIMPLWPGQRLPTLTGRLGARPVAPGRPYDAAGTALTAVLLASAILATRVVQARRRDEPPRTMPLEGLGRPDAGRHRLA
ncbi:hypothetical protein DQ384_19280 [Sphaerisporangium album]|uniref:Uncharacterized protein n=1 Tax=Sphaerisporangium album TaxID=509200 RepID=A0A367FHC4_9ACTN|nr:hypothetical protein [Sphaerisporangium album]RCG29721.1 hypothetical protein DQ384_19280 [Sphaerisporangium album]